MCPELCKKCNRILIYCYNEQAKDYQVKDFFWCVNKNRKKDYYDHTSYIFIIYGLEKGKWKKIRSKQHDINVNDIDKILKKFDLDMVSFPDFDTFNCPCHMEHQIYDWNEK